MATELIPYKGFSIFLAYLTVPLFQMSLSGFLSYTKILMIFIAFTIVAVYVAYYFNRYVNYLPFSTQPSSKEVK